MEVNEKIRFIRLFKNLSQEEMAQKLKMAVKSYAKIERGEVDVNLSRLEQISKVLEVELGQLVGLNKQNIFYWIENSHGFIQSSNNVDQTDCKHELEKTQLIIEQQMREIDLLKQQNQDLREMLNLLKKCYNTPNSDSQVG